MEKIPRGNKDDKLRFWQQWLGRNDSAYERERAKMDAREKLYRGETLEIRGIAKRDNPGQAPHLRNIVSENIEAMINSAVPQPKVTARRFEDTWRAQLIENMLRNELDRLPMEELNDMMERTIPIQGGAYWVVQWDNRQRTANRVGDVTVSTLHPKQIVPQDGVFTRVEDMDAVVIKTPQTKSYVARVYGVDNLDTLTEIEPDIKGSDDVSSAEDLITMYTAYYRNDNGGIGRYVWCGDVTLEDIDDYQARQPLYCADCGELMADGEDICTACGSRKKKRQKQDEEEVWDEIRTQNGSLIPGAVMTEDGSVVPTRIPYYKPDVYPVFLQRNISVYGKLLGDSDVDKIADQQNTINRMEKKIIDRFVKAGTRITLPDRADFRVDPEDSEKWYIGNAADKNLIGVYDFSGDLTQELNYLQGVYEEARQLLGITDSYQGRNDSTAQSGKAKEFAAAQSAGRLESKRVLKDAAYAELFKRIFQLKLAYADEPRPIYRQDEQGKPQYTEFNRYDFLKQDEKTGKWYWLDDFLFSCDNAAPLANNRQAMWENTTASLQAGAFGNPADMATLVYYWAKMELLHYPGAGETRSAMEKRLQQQQQTQQVQQQSVQQTQGNNEAEQIAAAMAQRDIQRQVDNAAKRDAMAAVQKR